jgi:hypothetical protein
MMPILQSFYALKKSVCETRVSHQHASLGTAQLTAGSLYKAFEHLAAPKGVSLSSVGTLQPARDICMVIHPSSLSSWDRSSYLKGYNQALIR